jgi:hypothetical protein
MKTWKPISSLEDRYEICLETKEVRIVKNKKLLKLNKQGYYNSSWGLGFSGKKYRWGRSVNSLMDEVFPFWWIQKLNEDEECTEIKNFSGYYITNQGKIYSIYAHKWTEGKYKFPYYYSVELYKNGIKFKQHIHTLIGRHFLKEYQKGMLILHKDETLPYPQINYPDNLWVGNCKDNNVDRCKKGRSGGWMIGKVYDGVLQTGIL